MSEQPKKKLAQVPAKPGFPPRSQIILYQTEDAQTRIEVRLEGNTVWLTHAQIAELFQTTPQNITLHLRAIYAEGELEEGPTCKDYLQVRQEGAREVQRSLRHYNLDAVLAVGYRVRSHRGTQFRRWATERLREYLVKGFCRTSGDGTPRHVYARLDRQARRVPAPQRQGHPGARRSHLRRGSQEESRAGVPQIRRATPPTGRRPSRGSLRECQPTGAAGQEAFETDEEATAEEVKR